MGKNSIRIVVDTNLWISFLISENFHELDTLILSERLTLLFSVELIQELAKTAEKPKLKKFLSGNSIVEMLLAFEDYMEIVDVRSRLTICRDAKDDFLINLAFDGKADFLITGDQDLLVLGEVEGVKIITLSSFIKLALN